MSQGRPLKAILAQTRYCPALEEGIRKRIPVARFAYVTPDGEVFGDVSDAEIFIAWGLEGKIIEPVIKQATDLRWFHLMSAGVESLMFPSLRDSDTVLTNASGVLAAPIAESVLAVMLVATKNLRGNFENAQRRHWERLPRKVLYGQTAGILGLGKIGSEVARRLKCMDMCVMGVKRRPDLAAPVAVDQIYGPDQLFNFLDRCDWVIVCAPLTPQTRHMLGEVEFRKMRQNAWFVNVSRGEVADEAALLRALDESWISGACLDAFAEEPLPENSPFWNLPNVILTPHNASDSPDTIENNLELVFDNFERFLEGRALRNIVDKEAGY